MRGDGGGRVPEPLSRTHAVEDGKYCPHSVGPRREAERGEGAESPKNQRVEGNALDLLTGGVGDPALQVFQCLSGETVAEIVERVTIGGEPAGLSHRDERRQGGRHYVRAGRWQSGD